jgi:hypothetical protein
MVWTAWLVNSSAHQFHNWSIAQGHRQGFDHPGILAIMEQFLFVELQDVVRQFAEHFYRITEYHDYFTSVVIAAVSYSLFLDNRLTTTTTTTG